VNAGTSKFAGLKTAYDDLAWLSEHGALAGVAEILHERRRQIEVKGHTPESDDGRFDFASMASLTLARVNVTRQQGTADIGSDEDGLRRAAALAAAEIDRLNRVMTPEGQG